jgi:asparagine synthetase B (glutamine-hydrolysing)
MGGLCIVAPTKATLTVDTGRLDAMSEILTHRGPDGKVAYLAPGSGLAVWREALNDLVPGDQPVSNERGSDTVVCNGGIFNFLSRLGDDLFILGSVGEYAQSSGGTPAAQC